MPDLEPNEIAQPVNHRKRRWLKKIRTAVMIVGIAYMVIIVVLVVNETSLVYPASKYPRGNWEPDQFEFEEVTFVSKDGTELGAWYLPRDGSTQTAILCHGNAENAAQASQYVGQHLRMQLNADVLVFDYRGYGKSHGTPHEKGVLEDSEAAMDFLCHKTGKSPNEILVVGHSIGGGPAVHLAYSKGAKALILQRTFSSLVDAAQSRYWFVPVSYLMRNRYPSDEKIKECEMPLFQSHGARDQIVPIDSGRDLYAASPAEKKFFYEIEDMNHFGRLPSDYWKKLRVFVDEIGGDEIGGDEISETPTQ